MTDRFTTPILFIIFNRLDTASVVFQMIKKIKPLKLFISSDGPRNIAESEIVNAVRKMIECSVDWDCELKVLYREKNVGCKIAVSEAVNWFFENVEEGIILEDDCLPNLSFFYFCQELLERYRNDDRVMHIGGANFQDNQTRGSASYYFSKFCHIWGWATWRRAWSLYDRNMSAYPDFIKNNRIAQICNKGYEKRYWLKAFDSVFDNKIDTWDFQWVFTVWHNNGLSIIPNRNLVANIGFGPNATHTKSKNVIANLPTEELSQVFHPDSLEMNFEADKYYGKNFSYIRRLINKFKAYTTL